MQIFINEQSLQGQYPTHAEFEQAVLTFMAIFSLISEKIRQNQLYKDSLFLSRQAIKNEAFQASFNQIRNKNLKDAFRGIIFNKLNPRDWRTEQVHNPNDVFTYNQDVVTDTSLAELAERHLQNEILLSFLVNFSQSQFANLTQLEIVKNKMDPISLDCVESKTGLEVWLETHFHLSSIEYDIISKDPPTDRQTILGDTTRFKPTTYFPQGRRAYQEIKTGYYWYVDNSHYGSEAHLEVFNRNHEHIGIADLQGNIDETKKVKGRTFNR